MRPSLYPLFVCLAISPVLYADATDAPQTTESKIMPSAPKISAPFTAFTGRITKNKVRMRLQANLDSPILREMNRNDLIVVVGESDEFYAVQPPSDIRGYVFRTYILENIVEGNKVNVRLEPNIESPVIAQLNSGDHVDGKISSLDKKWLEIAPPTTTKFFIAKEYVDKIGDANYMSMMEKKRADLNQKLNDIYLGSQAEFQKPFSQINLEATTLDLSNIIAQYNDFPEQAARAKEMLASIQDTYAQKKLTYASSKTLAEQSQKDKSQDGTAVPLADNNDASQTSPSTSAVNSKMTAWMPVEQRLYENWLIQNPDRTLDEFYQDQWQHAVTLKGVLEAYSRPVKNRPGDYILVNPTSNLPIAYLYSTQVNLQDKIGQEIVVHAVSRENNNFAFPAYFVLSLQ